MGDVRGGDISGLRGGNATCDSRDRRTGAGLGTRCQEGNESRSIAPGMVSPILGTSSDSVI